MGRFRHSPPTPGNSQGWVVLKDPHLAPEHSIPRQNARRGLGYCSPHPSPAHRAGEDSAGREGKHWGTHRPGVGVGASAGVFSVSRASAGDMRGGGPLKYLSLFPQMSLQGTQPYPARPWGQPRLEVQRAAPQGGGRGGERKGRGKGRGGAKPGEHQTLGNMPSSKAFLLMSKPHHRQADLLSTPGRPVGEASGSLWARPVGQGGLLGGLQEPGRRQGSPDRGLESPWWLGQGSAGWVPSAFL